MFGIVFFRLWFLQILSGQEFVAQANDNRLRRSRWSLRAAPSSTARAGPSSTTGPDAPSASGSWMCPRASWTLVLRLARVLKMRPGKMRRAIMDHLEPSWQQGEEEGGTAASPGRMSCSARADQGLDLVVRQGGRRPCRSCRILEERVVPGGGDPGATTCARTRRATWRRSCSATSARSRPSSSGSSTSRATRPATWSATTAWSTPTTSGCAAAMGSPGSRSTPSAGPSRATRSAAVPEAGDTLVTTLDARSRPPLTGAQGRHLARARTAGVGG